MISNDSSKAGPTSGSAKAVDSASAELAKPVRSGTLRSQVVDILRHAIFYGKLQPEELLTELRSREEGKVYRIALGGLRADPRVALRASASLSEKDRDEIARRLGRLDERSSHGPWTRQTLDVIRSRPGVRAGDLCGLVGLELHPFKTNVRKLKTLGLTESLEVGYRLSPRGVAFMRAESAEKP